MCECSRKIWVKSLFTFPLIDYFHTLYHTDLKMFVVGRENFIEIQSKNSFSSSFSIFLVDYIRLILCLFRNFFDAHSVTTHARSTMRSRKNLSARELFLFFSRRDSSSRKMCSSSIFGRARLGLFSRSKIAVPHRA